MRTYCFYCLIDLLMISIKIFLSVYPQWQGVPFLTAGGTMRSRVSGNTKQIKSVVDYGLQSFSR